jgi:hypothetical protein
MNAWHCIIDITLPKVFYGKHPSMSMTICFINSLFPPPLPLQKIMTRFVACLFFLFALTTVHALPEEYREEQRGCWRPNGCRLRETIELAPDFVSVYQPGDASVENPIEFAPITRGGKVKFTDYYAEIGILDHFDVDMYVLRYNHTAANNRSTAAPLVSNLWAAASRQTDNIEITWALFGASSLPVAVDGRKEVSESVVRARARSPISNNLRMLASSRLNTKNINPRLNSPEQKIKYYIPNGFEQGCGGTSPPFSLGPENCNYSAAIHANVGQIALPPVGEFYVVVYGTPGRPVPYVVTFGQHPLMNYMTLVTPFFTYIPSGEFVLETQEDRDMYQRVLQAKLAIGSIVEYGTDVQNGYFDFVYTDA